MIAEIKRWRHTKVTSLNNWQWLSFCKWPELRLFAADVHWSIRFKRMGLDALGFSGGSNVI